MSEVYNIIDKKKLDVVNKPINKAHGLPNECYTNKEYTLIERKKLFEDKWTVIGVASSLKNIGDVKPSTSARGMFGDAILTTLTNKNNPVVEARFQDLYPVSLGALDFTQTATDVEYITVTADFSYKLYEIVTL